MNDDAQDLRNQILHIETISMMTKYQLVFIKMESALIKVAHTIKTKESINLSQGFLRILEHARTAQAVRKYKTQLIYYNLKDNTEKMVGAIAVLQKGSLMKGFRAILLVSKAWKNEKAMKEEKEKYIKSYNEALLSKQQELTQSNKKLDELNTLLVASRNKENDLMSKLKQKEKQILALESENVDLTRSKKSPSGDATAHSTIRALEERIRELQQEKEDMRERLSSTENSIGNFYRDMSDLLTEHEAGVISDENASFQNQENEDEFETSSKLRDRGQNQNRAKETQGKVLPQRAGYQASQNRYKSQHIS